jgi:hypothetical protein
MKNFLRHALFFALLAVFILPRATAFGQGIHADVKLHLEKIPMDHRHKLANLQEKLTAYINDYDQWTDDEDLGDLYLNIQIFLQDISSNFEDRYAGQFLISNNSDLQFFDKHWRFNYTPGDAFYHQENAFNPLTSLIDFYINLVLGGEYDKIDRLAGTKYYVIAQDIAHQILRVRAVHELDTLGLGTVAQKGIARSGRAPIIGIIHLLHDIAFEQIVGGIMAVDANIGGRPAASLSLHRFA